MSIVCLGWGSLIWDPRDLPLASDWNGDGPELPIEFARQSSDGRITLVISHTAEPIPVLWAKVPAKNILEAKLALARREGVSDHYVERSIGFWTPVSASDHKEALSIGRWASDRDVEGVVWTALKPRFRDIGQTPTREEVIAYLSKLEGDSKARAIEYIRRTPRQIQTRYRAEIERMLDAEDGG